MQSLKFIKPEKLGRPEPNRVSRAIVVTVSGLCAVAAIYLVGDAFRCFFVGDYSNGFGSLGGAVVAGLMSLAAIGVIEL